MGELKLDPIPADELSLPLQYAAPSLLRALAKTDEIDWTGLVVMLRNERATLLLEYFDKVPQGCVVTTVVQYPLYRALEVLLVGGFAQKTVMYPNAHSFELLKNWARLCGCAKIQGFTDEAVGRLWRRVGFQEVKRLMRIDI